MYALLSGTTVQPTHDDSTSFPQLVTSNYHPPACDLWCNCRCHVPARLSTPAFLQQLIGRLHIRYAGLPFSGRQVCNEALCKHGATATTRTSYLFPSWLVYKRLEVSAKWNRTVGPELLLRVPNVVSPSSAIFGYVVNRDLDSIKELFAKRLASPFDVDSNRGFSPLHVSFHIPFHFLLTNRVSSLPLMITNSKWLDSF